MTVTEDRVVSGATLDPVGSAIACDLAGTHAKVITGDPVITWATAEKVVTTSVGEVGDRIGGAGVSGEAIVPSAAVNKVVAGATAQDVIATETTNKTIAAEPDDSLIRVSAYETSSPSVPMSEPGLVACWPKQVGSVA